MSLKKTKIALVAYHLNYGGLERVTSLLSKMFNEKNVDVTVILLQNTVSYPVFGKLKICTSNSKIGKYFELKRFLLHEKFDVIIDQRFRLNLKMELFWHFYIYKNQKVIYTIHSFEYLKYVPQNFLKITSFKTKYICVSNKIEEEIKLKYPKIQCDTITNPIESLDLINKETFTNTKKYIVLVGRFSLDNVKQVDVALRIYAKSILPKKGIYLYILGDGPLLSNYQKLAKNLNIYDKVYFKGFVDNVPDFLSNAFCTILTSKHEGFPMVLVESLQSGTPVIAFDCNSGPSEIIKNNGFLIENQNEEHFIQALNKLVLDEDLYLKFKKNAVNSVQKFNFEQTFKKWKTYLNQKFHIKL